MADLKHGAKGGAVKNLQKQLNAGGAKLKVDGIFGDKTEAALKAFQKKNGVKQTGVADKATMAAFDGGANDAVKMTVRDYADRIKTNKKVREDNDTVFEKQVKDIGGARTKLQKTIDKSHEAEKKLGALLAANRTAFKDWLSDAEEIAAKQAEFEKVNGKDPAKAKALLKECEALDKKAEVSFNIMKKNNGEMNEHGRALSAIIDASK